MLALSATDPLGKHLLSTRHGKQKEEPNTNPAFKRLAEQVGGCMW